MKAWPVWLLVPLMLAACVEVPPPPAEPSVPEDSCNAAGYQGLVGQSSDVLRTMLLPAGTRVIGPNDAITEDFRPERMNLEIGVSGRIDKIGCY